MIQTRGGDPISLSEIPNSSQILSKKEALNLLITSFAIEESVLTHMLEMESEKVNHTINQLKYASKRDLDKIIKINKSMEDVIEKIMDMQIILKNKLKTVLYFDETENESKCCLDEEKYYCEKCNCYHHKRHNC